MCKQDKLQEASSKAATRPGTAASPEQGKLAARLRAELEVHKEALQAAKEETANLASSLEKANSLIEVWVKHFLCQHKHGKSHLHRIVTYQAQDAQQSRYSVPINN